MLPLIAVACYLFGALGLGLSAYRADAHHGRGRRIAAFAIASSGVLIHAAALVDERRLDPQAVLSLGDTLAREFIAAKREEHTAYARHVSDWELQHYATAF